MPGYASTIPVLTNSDAVTDDGACTLREAITVANTDTASGASAGECPAGSGSDTINVPAMTIALGSRLKISSPIALVGNGVGNTIVDGQRHNMVFFIMAGQVTLQGITIQGGGGIWNQGTAYIVRRAHVPISGRWNGGSEDVRWAGPSCLLSP
ncbi:MAG: hypothetical protein V4805_17970 [Pseudomonadota bacterium]